MLEQRDDRSRHLIRLASELGRLRGKRSAQAAAELIAMELGSSDAAAVTASLLPVRVVPSDDATLRLELADRITRGVACTAEVSIQVLRRSPSAALPIATRALLTACGLSADEAGREVPDNYHPTGARDFVGRYEATDVVDTRRASEVADLLIGGGAAIALVGHSAAGKSTTAAQVCSRLRKLDWTPLWLDAGLPSQSAGDLIAYLARTPLGTSRRLLLVIDDVQSRPSLARYVASMLPILRRACAAPLSLLLLGWDSAAELIAEVIPEVRVVPCTGQQVLPDLVRAAGPSLNESEVKSLFDRARGNVFLARLVLNARAASRRLPQSAELASVAWEQVCGPATLTREKTNALYRVASLTQFQIESTESFAAGGTPDAVRSLLTSGIVRRSESGLSVGHPALGRLLCRHIKAMRPSDAPPIPEPALVALEFLRAAGDQVIATTLERLDFARLADDPIDQHGTAMLARAWECFNVLARNIASQTRADPTWGDNLASAVFAGMALAEGGHSEWPALAKYVRARWAYLSDTDLPLPQGGTVSAERKDFDLIRTCMLAQDADGYQGQQATTIDLDRTHRTWALGLLLCFEGSARGRDAARLERLKAIAAAVQDPSSGAFYPARIPWVTARIVLGLCAAGETVSSSRTVRRACEWLCHGPPDGPFRLVRWESGTGAWNSPEQTTALCLEALLKAGVDFANETVRAALPTIADARKDWGQPGKEIDAACGLQTFLLADRRWRALIRELEQVLVWAKAREPWSGATRSSAESGTESSKVPFVANALIGSIWQIVVSELPLLLEQMAMPDDSDIAACATYERSPALEAAMRAALGEIRSHVDDNLRSRQAIARQLGMMVPAAVKGELDEWGQRQLRVDSLESTWSRQASDGQGPIEDDDRALIEQVDVLGMKCTGTAWRSVLERTRGVRHA